ncbi:V-type ATPase subunit [Patescibacteria group bacterium]|nr:V-type ATPase subunit [Patescibacteria group bacterium]
MLEYAIGLINVLEKNIFDHQDQERMINAPDKESAFKVLFDTDLAEISVKEQNIEKILEKDFLSLRDIIRQTVKDEREELFWFLFLKFDALNLKIALKEKFSNDFKSTYSFDCSIVSFLDIQKRVEDSKYKVKNKYVESMIEEVLGKIKKASEIEETVDMVFLKTKVKITRKTGELPFQIVKLEIDIANLKNMIKGKETFINDGNLTRSELKILLGKGGAFSQNLDKFLEAYNLSLIISKFDKSNSEVELEKMLEIFLSEKILEKERNRGTGIDKVVSYFYRKINAHSNIRLIFFAKESSLSIKELKSNILPI